MVYCLVYQRRNNKELVKTLKAKKFNDMRKWVVNNIDKELLLFRGIYDVFMILDSKSVLTILIINGYQYKAALFIR